MATLFRKEEPGGGIAGDGGGLQGVGDVRLTGHWQTICPKSKIEKMNPAIPPVF